MAIIVLVETHSRLDSRRAPHASDDSIDSKMHFALDSGIIRIGGQTKVAMEAYGV